MRSCVAAMTSNQPVERTVKVTAESVWVDADPVRLEQIVGNLVSNALKFTPRERRVGVSVSVEGKNAALRVTDEGMDQSDVLPHIFDLFVQADVAIDRSEGELGWTDIGPPAGGASRWNGRGRDHGKGHGALFTVRLPASPSPVSDREHRSSTG